MNEPLVQRVGYDAETLAHYFDEMAKRIRLNKDSNFGGAFVLIPPAGYGDPVDSLLINSPNASLMFWHHLKSIAEQTINQVQEQQRLGGMR